jgi:hypothetical protein
MIIIFHIDMRATLLSEIPCRVSSDLHERRNDFPTVSNINSVKLNSSWRCEVTKIRRKDPVHLYLSFSLIL